MSDTEQTSKVAITNVRYFTGTALSPPTTIAITTNNTITFNPTTPTQTIDGTGCTLLPGLIESHCHPGTIEDVHSLTRHGVTTAFMLATYAPRKDMPFHGHEGLCDVRYGSAPAAAPGSVHGNLVKMFNTDSGLQVQGPEDAKRWVEEQMEWEPEFIKVIAQTPGMSQETLNALVKEAHGKGKKVACHAADLESQRQAMLAGVDQIHHSPSDEPAPESLASDIKQAGQIYIPTLSIHKALAAAGPGGPIKHKTSYPASRQTVTTYHNASIPILVGTDANNAIAAVPFGESMHAEMELLVEAGMSPVEVLRGATGLAAGVWGLGDRGAVEEGKRADLVLVEGDPTVDVGVMRKLRGVWVEGKEYTEKKLGCFDS